ncbi:MAG: GIY-YIG nuclease family protein [Candidatus Omnitrophota bacterium]|nr:GIY-YIG nuclease family protein [Candidatus Omnitrophota bacterium]
MNPALPMIGYVYILKSDRKDWIYIGMTSDLSRRLQQHYLGKNYSTKRYLPVRLVYYEAYSSIADAMKREKSLKYYGNALRELKKRIANSLGKGGAG